MAVVFISFLIPASMRFLSGLPLDMYYLLMFVQVGRSLESFRGATIQDSAFEGARVELRFVISTSFIVFDLLSVLSGLLGVMYILLVSFQVVISPESFLGHTTQDSAFKWTRVQLKFVVFTFFTISDSLGVLSSLLCLVNCFCVFSQGHEFAESFGVTVRDSVLVRARVVIIGAVWLVIMRVTLSSGVMPV